MKKRITLLLSYASLFSCCLFPFISYGINLYIRNSNPDFPCHQKSDLSLLWNDSGKILSANCRDLTISLSDNQIPGKNVAIINASDLDNGSTVVSGNGPFFKVIRFQDLMGTRNGTNHNQDDPALPCVLLNGDDHEVLVGNQIYFDDRAFACCADAGKKVLMLLRVFEKDPGPGPIDPLRMEPGGDLYQLFSDCISFVQIEVKSIPTLVPPSNVVASCQYPFDLNRLSDPLDSSFGRVVKDLSTRSKVTTSDIVCHSYCVENVLTAYPGFIQASPPSNPPASNRACNYYKDLIDTSHPDRLYELAWGFDGYAIGSCDVEVSIVVEDLRVCGKGRINRRFNTTGPNGVKVTTMQTIWIVDCDEANPNISIQLDSVGELENGFANVYIKALSDNLCYPDDQTLLTYELDLFNDKAGKYPDGFDYKVGPLSFKEYQKGFNPFWMDNPAAFDPKNPADASGLYPVGTHRIRWTAADSCGSVHTTISSFVVKETVSTIQSLNAEKILLTPNPASGIVNVYVDSQMNKILLVRSTGELVNEFKVEQGHHLQLNALKDGIYFVQAFQDGILKAAKKLIIVN